MKWLDVLLGKYVWISKEELLMLNMELRSYKGLWEQRNEQAKKELLINGFWVQKCIRAEAEAGRYRRELEELRKI